MCIGNNPAQVSHPLPVYTVEPMADYHHDIAEKFLEGEEVSAEEMYPVIREATLRRDLTPVFCGSAYKNRGVQVLLNGVERYLPTPPDVQNTASFACVTRCVGCGGPRDPGPASK